MNLKIDGQKLRFRISKQELEYLCSGTNLEQCTNLPNGEVLIKIITTKQMNQPLSLNYKDNNMTLYIEETSAHSLLESLPNRSGIAQTQETGSPHPLELSLDVDVFTQKRKRA